ncbi:SET domain-containing protein SmydA-8-like isoform X2 [Tigriopus californicus]|nr:SET domain-containing protein SmydA-8-like isoform X2 [Tigriopus californicus]|eukprot:TCALIF_06000-PA protein Name:"Similar to msta Protein msta, isoform A (Drosophila melanogaster)" AED:0.13 eAED:0.13 QI:18/1/1/1/1/1/4/154/489
MNTNGSLKQEVKLNTIGSVIKSVSYEIKFSANKGRGAFLLEPVEAGNLVLLEQAAVIGPKQTSPLVCLECFTKLSTKDLEYCCSKCGSTLCQSCSNLELRPLHDSECQIFQQAGHRFNPSTEKGARALYNIVTPLRFLLRAERNPEILFLHDNAESRQDTLIYCFNQVTVARTLREQLQLKERFSEAFIHKACGILDTNCYELGWNQLQARGLFLDIAHINHDCVPNCFKFFDENNNMCVMSAQDLQPGDELTLSYTPPLMSTPLRQVILQQTKLFVCHCARCHDPKELGAKLAALKCSPCGGDVLPENPIDLNSDFRCESCATIVPSERGKMMLDTAMKFVGKGSGNTQVSGDTFDVIQHLGRFLRPTHNLIVDLKLRFLNQLLMEVEHDLESRDTAETQEKLAHSLGFGLDLLNMAVIVNPGKSRLRGIISDLYHKLDKHVINGQDIKCEMEALMSEKDIQAQFKFDRGFHANNGTTLLSNGTKCLG